MNQTISTPSHSYVPAYSLFAQLLAQENLQIVVMPNQKTASFSPSTRTLTLPSWEGFDNATWLLFIAHEVGHALFTPQNALTDHPVWLRLCTEYSPNAVKTVTNVFEDIRIERLVRLKYRGLSGTFNRGYHALLCKNFFGFASEELITVPGSPIGLSTTAWADRALLDRINIYAKVGTLLRVSLSSSDEITWYNRGLGTQTFDDVLVLVEDVMRQLTEEQRRQMANSQPGPSEMKSTGSRLSKSPADKSTASASSDASETSESASSETSEASSSETSEASSSKTSESSSSETSKASPSDASKTSEASSSAAAASATPGEAAGSGGSKTDPVSVHDPFVVESQSKAEASLERATWRGHQMAVLPSKTEVLHECDVTLEEMIAEWPATPADRDRLMGIMQKLRLEQSPVLSSMIATFRANQSAWQHQRVTTSRSGVIDPIKLSQYKLTEDLFLRRSALPNAQNHGFVIHVDLSGSMNGKISVVLWQVLHLIWFAESAHIPIRVYGFSDSGKLTAAAEARRRETLNNEAATGNRVVGFSWALPRLVELYRSDAPTPMRQMAQALLLSQVLFFGGISQGHLNTYHSDSCLPKSLAGVQASEIRFVFGERISHAVSKHPLLGLGGTPLWYALVSSVDTVRAFRQKNRIEQCISVWLTDGEDTHHVPIITASGIKSTLGVDEVLEPRSGLRLDFRNRKGLSELFRLHRTLTGASVICIDITESPLRSFERVVSRSTVQGLCARVGQTEFYRRGGRRQRRIVGRTVKQTRRRVVMTYQKATFVDAGVMLISAREFPELGCDAYLVTHPDWWTGIGSTDDLHKAQMTAQKVLAQNVDADADDDDDLADIHRPVRLAKALQDTKAHVAMRRFADMLVPYMASGRDDASLRR